MAAPMKSFWVAIRSPPSKGFAQRSRGRSLKQRLRQILSLRKLCRKLHCGKCPGKSTKSPKMTPYHFYAKDKNVRNCSYSHSKNSDTAHYYPLTAIMSGAFSEHTLQEDGSSQQAMGPPTLPSQNRLPTATAQRGLPAHQGLGRGRSNSPQARSRPNRARGQRLNSIWAE